MRISDWSSDVCSSDLAEFWAKFDAGGQAHPGDPRAGLMMYFDGLAKRAAASAEYRGCGLTNAAVEYPEPDHPARRVAVAHKAQLQTGRTSCGGRGVHDV